MGIVGLVHVVDHHRLAGDRGAPGRARLRVEGQLDALEERDAGIGARHPVAAQHAARAVHQEELRALVRHAVHEPGERLVVDLLGVERGAHRRAEVGQQRELLDPRLELGELLLELAVRVDDLLGLEVEEPLDVAPPAPLAQRVAERHARDQGERRRHREEPAPARHRVHHAEGDRARRAHQARQPEVPAERRVLPADLPAARVVSARGAGALGDPGPRQPPVRREALVLDAEPGARPERHPVAGERRPLVAGAPPTDLQHVDPVEAALRVVDRRHPLVGGAGVADPHRVGAQVRALLAGLPVHEGLGEAAGPALLVRLVHQALGRPGRPRRRRAGESSCGRP